MSESEMPAVFLCSSCGEVIDLADRVVLPIYDEDADMLLTSYICRTCAPAIAEKSKVYARTASEGEPWSEDGSCKHNEVLEKFAMFFLHVDFEVCLGVRYAPSIEEGIQAVSIALDGLLSGAIQPDPRAHGP